MSTKDKGYSMTSDLTDSPEDTLKLGGDQGTLDLPSVKDIPGQENIKPAPLSSIGDRTISSDDEEGDDILEEDDLSGAEDNVSATERKVLSKTFDPSYDTDEPVEALALDSRDNEGELLEEKGLDSDLFGEDLDDGLTEEEDEETDGENEDNQ